MKIVNVEKLVDRLVEECTENIEETRLVGKTSAKNENKHKYSSCIVYIVLFSLSFAINVGIGLHFVYSRWYLKKVIPSVKFNTRTQTII